jgi:transcriptional regulator with XRE-family HTH domain
MSRFREELKRRREAAGLSQEGLARAVDLSVSTVVKLESGRSDPSWKTVQRLASFFQTSTDSFADEVLAAKPRARKKRSAVRPSTCR